MLPVISCARPACSPGLGPPPAALDEVDPSAGYESGFPSFFCSVTGSGRREPFPPARGGSHFPGRRPEHGQALGRTSRSPGRAGPAGPFDHLLKGEREEAVRVWYGNAEQ